MKQWLFGLGFLLFSFAGYCQQQESFSSIDWKMQSTEAPTPDSLGRIINGMFRTELEKTRAIYAWITSHIDYNTAIYKPWSAKYEFSPDPLDTASVWPSGDEMVARKVMRRRTAVCDGYARLFKVLCDYTGIEAAIVQGYARAAGSNRFRTNHTWNTVKIDSVWHLVDVTWASGYLTFSDNYVRLQNDFYFFTPPDQFIADHYPEDFRWVLLPNPPMLAEFRRAPFRSKNFYRYGFDDFSPSAGVLEAVVGDTLKFTLQLKDLERAKHTGNDPFTDTASFALWPASAFVKPASEKKNQVTYSYIVQPASQWLHLLYNNDVVMQYRISITNKPSVVASN